MYASQKAQAALLSASASAEPPMLSLDLDATIAAFPGPALCFDRSLTIVKANEAATVLSAFLDESSSQEPGSTLKEKISNVALLHKPAFMRTPVGPDAEQRVRHFDLTLLPVQDGADNSPFILCLGAETSVQQNLISALSQSRNLFRDLVACSSDFAWETDQSGALTFVGGNGALGYAAAALNGRPAISLFAAKSEIMKVNSPFSARKAVEDIEVWLTGADGKPNCFLVSALPILDKGGTWRGARGVGHDVTELREKETLLAQSKARDQRIRLMIDEIHAEPDTTKLLPTAAKAIGMSCSASRCQIFMGTDDQCLLAAEWTDTDGEDPAPQTATQDFKTKTTTLQGRLNGLVRIVPGSQKTIDDDLTDLVLEHAVHHVAISIAQVQQFRRFEELSETDELTALPNRRAFAERASARIAHHEVAGRPGAFLYMDLDNFKAINDTLGHAVGDDALQFFAECLRSFSRDVDVPVRLGGDEFGLWLDNTDLDGAELVATRILEHVNEGAQKITPEVSWGVSVGIGLWHPGHGDTLTQLLDRADGALYEAKTTGKGRIQFSFPQNTSTETTAC